jgi:hypothetical protein
MEERFSREMLAELHAAQRAQQRRRSRLRIDLDGRHYPVLRLWKTGFAVAVEDAPQLRGLVDVYDGSVHLFQCLIVASSEDTGEMLYEFKRATAATDRAPLDFEQADTAPAGLITDAR